MTTTVRPTLSRRPAMPHTAGAVELGELVRALRRRRHTIVKIGWLLGIESSQVRSYLYPAE